jgi:predicted RNA-binding Zn ribbon-like protein
MGEWTPVAEASSNVDGAPTGAVTWRSLDSPSLHVEHETGHEIRAFAVELDGTRPDLALARWRNPDAVTVVLAMLSIEGFFTLPRERLRSCPRCGWLFLDTSRGGKRRWCSMQVCGNREKVSRHREHS